MTSNLTNDRLIRTSLFIDGGYFDAVNKFHLREHPREAAISVAGLQELVRVKAAEMERLDHASRSQIVESHYFRGRFSTDSAIHADKLEDDRRFDEQLIRANVVPHYLPIDENRQKEKGIDVWLALEAFDLAVHKRFDVLALVAGDGDYVQLVRKLSGLGTRVMLLSWDFDYWHLNHRGERRHHFTRTSNALRRVTTYPINMLEVIDGEETDDFDLDRLFLQPAHNRFAAMRM
jgi:uncharacterized LabA/DUF88 family protein